MAFVNPFYREPGKRNEEVDLVHHGPCFRSMDQRILVYREPRSRPRATLMPASRGPRPSGGPWLRRGSAAACHVSGLSPAQIQP